MLDVRMPMLYKALQGEIGQRTTLPQQEATSNTDGIIKKTWKSEKLSAQDWKKW